MSELSAISQYVVSLETLLGIPLFAVGGSVRDTFIGKTSHDWDFTTPVLPDDIETAIKQANLKPFVLGKRFGTVAFIDPNTKEMVEITTFRSEVYKAENRKPEVIFSSTLQEDLSRRDFTMNALAVDSKGVLYDFFNGQADITNKTICTVGNAKRRFSEDPLRLLRAIRFATCLNFSIEEKTWESIVSQKFRLVSISKERWMQELNLILSSPNVRTGLNLLMSSGLLGIMIPELVIQHGYNQQNIHHDFDLWTHTLNVVEAVPADNLNLRWAALLHDVAKPFVRTFDEKKQQAHYVGHDIVGAEMAKKIGTYLKWSKNQQAEISEIILHHLLPISPLKVYDDGGKKRVSE